MHPDLERLAALNDVDAELDKLARDLMAARQAVTDAATGVADATKAREAAQAALDAAKTDERALYRKIDEYKTREQGAIRILETGAGNPDSAEKQLAQCRQILDETETEVLELMERMDVLNKALADAEASLKTAIAKQADVDRSTPGRTRELDAATADAQARRKALWDEIPTDYQRRYDQLRASKRKHAVARVVDGTCEGCRMSVPTQQISDIKRGIVESCRGCGRWLVTK